MRSIGNRKDGYRLNSFSEETVRSDSDVKCLLVGLGNYFYKLSDTKKKIAHFEELEDVKNMEFIRGSFGMG